MSERADTVMSSAAEMHDCEVAIETTAEAPSAVSDDALAGVVYDAADSVPGVTSRLRTDDLGGSEDATYLMNRVQNHGGTATFVGIGTDHPGGHHTPLFDIDEDSLTIGIDVVTEAISQLSG